MRVGRLGIVVVMAWASAGWVGGAPAVREPKVIEQEIRSATADLKQVIASTNLLDAGKRAEAAPKAIPVLNRIEGLMKELEGVAPSMAGEIIPRRFQLVAMRGVFGDTSADATLKESAGSVDPGIAMAAKTAELTKDWVLSAQDAAAQNKVLDRSEALAKASPTNVSVAMLLASYVQFGAASPANRERAISIIQKELKGPVGDDLRAQLAKRAAAATKPGI